MVTCFLEHSVFSFDNVPASSVCMSPLFSAILSLHGA